MGMKKWFHDSRPEIWKQLSAELGGRYTHGKWMKGDRIDVSHGEWMVTFDTYVIIVNKVPVPFTRLRAPFLNSEKMRLKVYRASIFTELGKFFGMQDLTIGDAQFDKDFVLKGNDERRVREFLANEKLRALLSAQKDVTLSVEDDEGWFGAKFPENTDELRVVIHGHEKNPERLRELFTLFAEGLDQLCRIGSAYEDAPTLKL
ncbi:MAG: DUF3137 domain-containing protein [Planctomycetes bacterium]|nr:DUF3137 domain-containing protein [Planctomycetota bacterium]